MTAIQLTQAAAQAVFVVLFLFTLIQAVRRPEVARVDVALFFGAAAASIVRGRLEQIVGPLPDAVRVASTIAVLAMPYLLLRLLHDLVGVRRTNRALAMLGFVLCAVLVVALPAPLPAPATLAVVAYFVVVAAYASIGFVRAAAASPGITRRRMQAIALGSGLLALAILVAGVLAVLPLDSELTLAVVQGVVLLCALAYYAGFATPNWLRRLWREPELRAFLARAAQLPRLPDTRSIVLELERHVGASLGARAAIGLWDAQAAALRFGHLHDALPDTVGPSEFPTWRVFESQRATYFPDAALVNPAATEAYRAARIEAMLVAPITAGERRVGVLAAYAGRRPIFADEDLAYVQLLADQAAVVLESRALIDEAARVRAQEEATRMKEDFISAAAHDLRTPLTTVVGQAELLERRFRDDPGRSAELAGAMRILRTSTQLADLVEDLLEAARLEQGRVELDREPADLAAIARDAAAHMPGGERVTVEAESPVMIEADVPRMRQVVRNLLENAVKYSPGGATVTVRAWSEGSEARLSVRDGGIGIPAEDLPMLFERFRRASNVNARRFSGMGLGLYICREVLARHGGRIWAESTVGSGSTFHVAVPVSPST